MAKRQRKDNSGHILLLFVEHLGKIRTADLTKNKFFTKVSKV
jgi:hypothetical protein